MNLHRFKRKLEPLYTVSPYIAEFWNTMSNLPFIILGLLRLYEVNELDSTMPYEELEVYYILMVLAGIASGYHHASQNEYTIIIDWIPILTSIILLIYQELYIYVSYANWFCLLLSFSILTADHIFVIHVPLGHVMWHLLACLSVDSMYQNIAYHL